MFFDPISDFLIDFFSPGWRQRNVIKKSKKVLKSKVDNSMSRCAPLVRNCHLILFIVMTEPDTSPSNLIECHAYKK